MICAPRREPLELECACVAWSCQAPVGEPLEIWSVPASPEVAKPVLCTAGLYLSKAVNGQLCSRPLQPALQPALLSPRKLVSPDLLPTPHAEPAADSSPEASGASPRKRLSGQLFLRPLKPALLSGCRRSVNSYAGRPPFSGDCKLSGFRVEWYVEWNNGRNNHFWHNFLSK